MNTEYTKTVDWGNSIIAPVELWGGWMEITYSPVMGEGMKYDISMPGEDDWSVDPVVIQKMLEMMGTDYSVSTVHMLGIEYKYYSPFIIKIRDDGRLELLMCNKEVGDEIFMMVSPNLILRHGEEKISKKRKW